jgi:hypothetical protein
MDENTARYCRAEWSVSVRLRKRRGQGGVAVSEGRSQFWFFQRAALCLAETRFTRAATND